MTGRNASSTNPATWASFDDAVSACERLGCDGVGYVFAEHDSFCGIDLDACHDPATGKLTLWAQSIVKGLGGYCEVSPSGYGVKIFVRAKPRPGHSVFKPKNVPTFGSKSPEVAIYGSGRFFCITGQRYAESPATIEDRQRELDALCSELWPVGLTPAASPPTTLPPATAELGEWFATLVNRCANALAGERSQTDFALAAECSRRGLDVEAVWPLVESIGKFAEGGRRYFDLTWRKAAEAVAASRLGLLEIEGRNDLANAKRFVAWLEARHGLIVRYCDSWRRWLIFDGRRWATDEVRAIESLAKQYSVSLWEAYRRLDHKAIDDKALREVRSFIRATNGATGIANFLALARSEPSVAIRAEELDADSWLFNCENGTLNLRTGELRPHRREDYITQLCPVPYDPGATCPRFDQFLQEIFAASEALIAFVQRLCGYFLTGSVREQKLPIWHGLGGNGKSILMELLLFIFGSYGLKAPAKLLMAGRDRHPTEIAALFRKRAAFCSETDENGRLDEAIVKSLTGGDRITARRLYQDFTEFDPTHKLVLVTNHRPAIRGSDNAIWRRIQLVPFNVTIEEARQNKDLSKELVQEAPGVLAWLVRGCLEWQRKGLNAPPEARQATDAYKADENILGGFIDECCTVSVDEEAGASELLSAYRDLEGNPAMTPKQFATLLRSRGFRSSRYTTGPHKGRIRWHGIRLRVKEGEEE
ncbi:MAG TPA: phage/plasmid primase, P4 family [Pirellulales bacterium]|nr:phage/plasmid primase, P4 family [Pirellulales bacterium]